MRIPLLQILGAPAPTAGKDVWHPPFHPNLPAPGKQPRGHVGVDWTNPLTRGLQECFVFNKNTGGRGENLAGTIPLTIKTEEAFYTQYADGHKLFCGLTQTVSNRVSAAYPAGVIGSGDMTVICSWNPRVSKTSGYDTSIVSRWNTGATPSSNEWLLGANNHILGTDYYPFFAIEIGSTTYVASNTTQWTSQQTEVTAGVRRGTQVELHRKGYTVSTTACGAGAINEVSARTLQLGEIDAAGVTYSRFSYDYCFIFNRALSEAEIQSVFSDPYQFLKPLTDAMPVVVQAIPEALPAKYWLRDRRLLDPRLSVPTLKPLGKVELDMQHPLVREMKICWAVAEDGGQTVRNLVKNELGDISWVQGANTFRDVGHSGKAIHSNTLASSDTFTINTTDPGWWHNQILERTWLFHVDFDNPAVGPDMLIDEGGNTEGLVVAYRTTPTAFIFAVAHLGSITEIEAATTTSAYTRNLRVCATYNRGRMRLFINGRQEASSDAGPSSIDSHTGIPGLLGGDGGTNALGVGDNQRWDGNFYMATAWSRGLTDAEAIAVTLDPYQFLKPATEAVPIVVEAADVPEAPPAKYWLYDRKLLSPHLAVPLRRPMGMLYANPDYRLRFGFLYGHTRYHGEVLSGVAPVFGSAITLSTDSMTAYANNANSYQDVNSLVNGVTAPWTIIHHVGKWTSSSSYNYLYDQTDRFILRYRQITDATAAVYDGTTWQALGGTGDMARFEGESFVAVWVMREAGADLIVDGELIGSASFTTKTLGGSAKLFDRFSHDADNNFNGWSYSLSFLNKALSIEEAKKVSRDPYVVYQTATPDLPIIVEATTPGTGDGGTGTPGAHVFYEKFLERVGDGQINLSTVVLKCALVSDLWNAAPGGGATATDPRWGAGGDQDLSTNEVSGGNYTAGGVAIDGTDPWALSTPQAVYTAQTATWASGGATPPDNIRWAVIYDDTSKYAVSYILMYDGDVPLTLDTQGIQVRWNAGVSSGTMFHATQA